MRHYEADSTPAAARILALTVLADGGLDRDEIDAAMRTDLARRLGIGQLEFERILREYCDDLMLGAHYMDGMRLRLADEVLDLVLEDISEPALQQALLRAMQDIVSADGVETLAEVEACAASTWSRCAPRSQPSRQARLRADLRRRPHRRRAMRCRGWLSWPGATACVRW